VGQYLRLSPEETAQIVRWFDDGLPVARVIELSGRSKNCIERIRRDTRCERRAFTETENNLLRTLYPAKGVKEIASILKRHGDDVRIQILQLGLSKPVKQNIQITVEAATASLLTSAAERRGMLPSELLSEICEGLFRRSNVPIDRLLSGRSFVTTRVSGIAE
jgi:hypothetical protein